MDALPLTAAEFRRDLLRSRRSDPSLPTAFAAGRAVRLLPGWYVDAESWSSSPPWVRTEIAAAAVSVAMPDACFSGITAAQLHGLPGRVRSPLLHLDKWTAGHVGRLRDTYAARGPAAALPRAPRRFIHRRGRPWDGVPVAAGFFLTVPLEIAVVEVAAFEPLTVALPVVDALLRAAGPGGAGVPGRQQLLHVVDAWPVGTQAALARRVIGLGDSRAESARESFCRAVFLLAGFEPPDLQTEFTDQQGTLRVDFHWPSARVVVEYDGQGKWTEIDVPTGKAQWDRIRRHNERHDRLLAQPGIDRVVHLTTEDTRDVGRLGARLLAAGVPCDPRRALEHPFSRGLAA